MENLPNQFDATLRYAGQLAHKGGTVAQATGTLATHEQADSTKRGITGTLTQGQLDLTNYQTALAAAGSRRASGRSSLHLPRSRACSATGWR